MRPRLLVALAVLTSCAPALRAPQPVARIGGGAAAPEQRTVDELLLAGERAWARRPDPAAVREALAASLAAARGEEQRIEGLVAACRAAAWLVEHESDAGRRLELVATGLDAAQWCGARMPGEPRCDYALAIALGQQARERPATAADGLARMVDLLRRAVAAAPELDEAGPHRVLALLLLRAPGWPAGPGDREEGLAEARRAVDLRPGHPPNLLALGEGLVKDGRAEEARTTYQRACDLAEERMRKGDPDAPEWRRECEAARAALRPQPGTAHPAAAPIVPGRANFRAGAS